MSFENDRATLVILCGLPGAGKTTLAKKLEKECGAVRLCPDEQMVELGFDLFDEAARSKVEAKLWKLGKELLGQRQDIILENGFWSTEERAAIRKEAEALGVDVEIHYLAVPFNELWRRVSIRNTSGDRYTVPLAKTQLMEYTKIFQPPNKVELALYTRAVIHRP